MLDPFRGELTGRYRHEDDLRWAAERRLTLQMKRAKGEQQSLRRAIADFVKWVGAIRPAGSGPRQEAHSGPDVITLVERSVERDGRRAA